MFGNPVATNFSMPAQTTAIPQFQSNSLQNVLENLTGLTTAVSGPELEGDDRDRVISCLNQLLASCGVGKGYYKKEANPYNFDINNPFYRLRAVGYNRLSKHKNSEGLVSLILNISANDIEPAAQKQKVIDTINAILRTKPAPAGLGQFGGQQAASAVDSSIKLYTEIKSIIPHGDTLTEIIINVNEYRRGIWNATDLYEELHRPQRLTQLKSSLKCEKIVPLMEVSKDELENYLKRPPAGFEEIWPQAIKENPDPCSLVPFPIQGFGQLVQRQKKQGAIIENQQAVVKDLMERLSRIEQGTCTAHNKYTVCKQTQKHLSYRLLRILATQTLIQRYGLLLDEKEEQLQSRLETLNAHLNAPERLRSRIMAVLDVLRKDGDLLKQRAQERLHSEKVLTNNMGDIKRCLASRQSLLEDLVGTVKAGAETLEIVENSRDK